MDKATYHISIAGALRAFYLSQVRDTIAKDNYTLQGALRMATTIEERINVLMAEPTFTKFE